MGLCGSKNLKYEKLKQPNENDQKLIICNDKNVSIDHFINSILEQERQKIAKNGNIEEK